MERMFLLGHPFSLDTLVGCALRTRGLVHGMHPTEGNGELYGIVNCSSSRGAVVA